MDGHAHTPPSYSGFSQYPTNPFGSAGGDESSNRASMPPPPPHGSSLPPLPPSYQTPPTGQQYGPQNFPGSSSSPSMLSHPSPSLLSLPPLSPSSIPYYPSETVANKDMASPQIPYMMLNSSSSSAGSSKDHKRGTSDNIIISGLNSLLARNNGIHPKPMEMPVGVSVGEKSSDEDVNVDVSNIGKKRRAGNEIAPPSKIWRSVSVESSLKRKSSHVGDVGNDNAYRGAFTADQMRTIAACDELKAMAATNPKYLKRVLSNRESAARSKERKALRLSELEDKVQTLETQIDTLTAELKLEKVT
ncbi:hypothetical protein N665_4554s0002 [Sinapis alba]|nr:hypothetical protein N665_4554s0002 [Sinapis alba]